MSGTGYVDRVDMKTRLGRSPYKDVRWGRIHYPDHTVVFNSIQLKDGIQVCNLAKWAVPSTIDTTDQFTVIEKPNAVDLVLPNRTTTLKPIRVLHRGSAFDAVRFPGAFERFFIRTLAGRMSESRYVSRASDSDNADGDPGWALYEHVVFG